MAIIPRAIINFIRLRIGGKSDDMVYGTFQLATIQDEHGSRSGRDTETILAQPPSNSHSLWVSVGKGLYISNNSYRCHYVCVHLVEHGSRPVQGCQTNDMPTVRGRESQTMGEAVIKGVPNLVHDYHSLGGGVNSFSSPARTTRNPPDYP